jgi:hypothetical protein
MLASLFAASILAGVLAATPSRVSAQARTQLQKPAPAVTDPCLPPNPNPFTTSSPSQHFLRRGFFIRRPIPPGAHKGSMAFARTELFFGTAMPDGGAVTPEQFAVFLDNQITPRFPDGLTVLTGDGQFRGSDGIIIKEDSFVLILLYPVETFKENSRRIENIRKCYLQEFQQESVLRADDPFASWVSF